MYCNHCLRGNAQNVHIKTEYIETYLKQFENIDTLVITGGEPSMNVPAIRFILETLKKYDIEVYRFYIATNGSKTSMSKKFIDVCMDLYNYQQSKSNDGEFMPIVELSDDYYHDKELYDEVIRTLDVYKFFGLKFADRKVYTLVKQGRSEFVKTGRELTVYPIYIEDENIIEGDIYLNALGYIVTDCDMSYKTQKKNFVCHVNDLGSYLHNLSLSESA